ncbi:DUF418 domain-containing protein [Kribbella sp. DT2]|uniref:DUF418 domain-containing protein n=1 Tax=Kribbella sp. DT2 TaxID=3393427 RepID=UPI003CF22520
MSPSRTIAGDGPTRVSTRALGPDLARGVMLVFIALANTHGFLHPAGVSVIRGIPIASSAADRVVAFAETVLVDGRSYTMFAALFGYGMVQITRRQEGTGTPWPRTRALLRRRGRWLVLFGVAHAVLLYYGDILAAYGLLALILASAVRHSNRRLLIGAGVWAVVGSVVYGFFASPMTPETISQVYPWSTEENPLLGAAFRLGGIIVSAPVLAVTAAAALLLGIWAAKHRLLEEPDRHLVLLRRIVVIGLPVAVLGGVPLALYTSGIVAGPAQEVVPVAVLHSLTGFAGGPAYAALIALWARKVRPNVVVTALQATGQRSLTCYLLQSAVWAVAFFPWLLDLGHTMPLWQSAILAVVTWAVTVVIAELLRRGGYRGPFEVLLRRLTYRP